MSSFIASCSTRRFESFTNFDTDWAVYSSPIFTSQAYSPPTIYSGERIGFSAFSPVQKEQGFNGGFVGEAEEGLALREWRRKNAIRLEEKEKKEKEKLKQIIEEAEEYKREFYRKSQLNIEKNKTSNREKEKVYSGKWEKFHGEAEKNYWKAVGELIPQEVAAIEKRGKKKASIVVIQGPKPGKPTDLTRMRQLLVKLKHNPQTTTISATQKRSS